MAEPKMGPTTRDVLCIIPARGGSKRLPRKNIVELAGKPMLAYTIEAALEAGLFDEVNVSTEDEEIASIARRHGASVPYMRPADLAEDRSGVVDVCLDMIRYFEQQGRTYAHMCCLLPSAPLRVADDIVRTYERLLESKANYAMAVATYFYSPWEALAEENGFYRPYWGHERIATKRQDRPALWVDSGSTYIVRTESFLRDPTFYGPDLVGYRIPQERAIDVDDSFGLRLAHLLLEARNRGTGDHKAGCSQ